MNTEGTEKRSKEKRNSRAQAGVPVPQETPRGPGEPGPYKDFGSDGRMWDLWLLHRSPRRLSLGLAGGGG
jgi:hypothetical protein